MYGGITFVCIMKLETGSFETSVPFYRSTRRHQEDLGLGFTFQLTKPPDEGSFSKSELFFKQISGHLYTICTVCVFVCLFILNHR